MEAILLKQVSKAFGEKQVLDGIHLGIEKGEFFGLLGPSGAGKTTIIKILTGQLHYEGEAFIFEEECKLIGKSMYKNIGLVLDNCGLYDRLSCYDNLQLFARIYGVDKKGILTALNRVGLLDEAKKSAGKLSKGMRQRLLLARAVLHNPRLLFLDEPTSGLDPATAEEIHQLLRELRDGGTTIFLTTHNMSEAYELCGHIALLNEGKIVEYGVPEEICRKYNKENIISILKKNGEIITVQNKPKYSSKIASLFSADEVESIHSSEPNLGTVFMTLTGRGLR